jgi:hypothetical protein
MMSELGIALAHTTILALDSYAPEVERRLRSQFKTKGSTFNLDDFVRIGRHYLRLEQPDQCAF